MGSPVTDRPGLLRRLRDALRPPVESAPVALQDAPGRDPAPLPAPEAQAAPQVVAMGSQGFQGGKAAPTNGVTVRKGTSDAFRVHVVFQRCVARRATQFGMMGRALQYRTADGWMSPTKAKIQVPAEGMELLDLFDRPVRSLRIAQASARWQQSWCSMHLDLSGNSMRQAVRSSALGRGRTGRPKIAELWVINPDRIEPILPGDNEAWVDRYMPRRTERELLRQFPNGIPADDLIHYMRQNPDNPYWGIGLLDAAAIAVDSGHQSWLHNLATVRNSGTPSGILLIKGLSSANDKHSQDLIAQQLTGAINAGAVLKLPAEGFDYKTIGLDLEKLQLIEMLGLSDEAVATACGVPIELITKKSTKFDDLAVRRLQEFDERCLEHSALVETETSCILPEYLDPREWRLVPSYDEAQIRAIMAERMAEPFRILTDSGVPQQVAAAQLGIDFGDGWEGWERAIIGAGRAALSDVVGAVDMPDDNADDGV